MNLLRNLSNPAYSNRIMSLNLNFLINSPSMINLTMPKILISLTLIMMRIKMNKIQMMISNELLLHSRHFMVYTELKVPGNIIISYSELNMMEKN